MKNDFLIAGHATPNQPAQISRHQVKPIRFSLHLEIKKCIDRKTSFSNCYLS
jgi:hypothetical protein